MATFRDFITECDMYEYSNEHYQLLKDVSSAELMYRYTENQRFIQTFGDCFSESGIQLGEGFFTESVSMDEVEVIEEKFTDTIRKVWNTIRKGLLKLINGVLKFLQKKRDNLETKIRATNIDIFFKGKVPKGAIDAFSAFITKHGDTMKKYAVKTAAALAAESAIGVGLGLFKGVKMIKSDAEAGKIKMFSGAIDCLKRFIGGQSVKVLTPNGGLPANGETVVNYLSEAGEIAADTSVAAWSRMNELNKKIDQAEASAKGMYESIAAERKKDLIEKVTKAQADLNATFEKLDSMSDNDQMSRSNEQEKLFQALKEVLPKLNKWASNLIQAEAEIEKQLAIMADASSAAAKFMGEAEKSDEFGDTAGADMYRDAARAETDRKNAAQKDLEKATKERNVAAQNASKALNQANAAIDNATPKKQTV